MIQPAFSEVIKVKDGIFYNLPLHQARMQRTTRHFYGKPIELPPLHEMLPFDLRKGLVKCRITYAGTVISCDFSPYSFKKMDSVAIIEDSLLDYSFKYTDRERLNTHLAQSGCDEIIIVKNGFLTDASIANLVFENETGLYTPDTFLLWGIKREYLLQKGIIKECPIKLDDIHRYNRLYLINAMMDLEDTISFPIASLVF